jgi:hypothetical protein
MIRALSICFLVDIVIFDFHIGRKCGVWVFLEPRFVKFND